MLIRLASFAFALSAACGAAAASPGVDLLVPGSAEFVAPGGTRVEHDVSVEGVPFETATKITSTGKYASPFDCRLQFRHRGKVRSGDKVFATIWLKCLAADDAPGPVGLVDARSNDGQWAKQSHKIFRRQMTKIAPRWKQYSIAAESPVDVTPEQMKFVFIFGGKPQTLLVGPVTYRNYGDEIPSEILAEFGNTYGGREADAPWRAEAAARIQKYRTGPLAVRVTDTGGRPVAGAKVSVAMTRHEFGFGSLVKPHLLVLDESYFPMTPKWGKVEHTWEDAVRYREIVTENFNRVTNLGVIPFIYKRHRAAKAGKVDDEGLRVMATAFDRFWPFAEKHGLEVRGHCLSWGSVSHFPERNVPHGKQEFYDYQTWAVDTIPAELGDRIHDWDTLNHPCGWGVSMEDLFGGLDFHVEIMRRAREASGPGVWHCANEGHIIKNGSRVDDYVRVLEYLNEHGQRPDAAGMMCHLQANGLPSMATCWERFERLAPYADHLFVSELDIGASGDERLHADYLRDFMTLCFSHPQMESVIMWGFWEREHWLPDTALWRKDWSIKPAGEAWLKLVNEDWWTETTVTTDADGRAVVPHAFFGDYRLTVGDVAHAVSHDAETAVEILMP